MPLYELSPPPLQDIAEAKSSEEGAAAAAAGAERRQRRRGGADAVVDARRFRATARSCLARGAGSSRRQQSSSGRRDALGRGGRDEPRDGAARSHRRTMEDVAGLHAAGRDDDGVGAQPGVEIVQCGIALYGIAAAGTADQRCQDEKLELASQ